MTARLLLLVLSLPLTLSAFAADHRHLVEMPEMMREHMLGNMRDHLVALETITRHLAEGRFDEAAEVAESRLGMSSMESHGAAHMAKVMPAAMAETGTAMHRAASRFALAARDADVEDGAARAFAALSEVMGQCVACHSAYRIH